MFEPTPIALGAYGAFTALRLHLAYARKLTKPLQYLSVAVDIGVLMALIWSYPFQYAAPFALYLKAPTLMYAFILIALRALRFDPLQVWAAGGLAGDRLGGAGRQRLARRNRNHGQLPALHDLACASSRRGA